jgi:hypothetical protein
MLTAFQVERVAYFGDGFAVCRKCAIARYVEEGGTEEHLDALSWREDDALIEKLTGLEGLDRYSAETSFAEGGLYCDTCTEAIVEDDEDEDFTGTEDV